MLTSLLTRVRISFPKRVGLVGLKRCSPSATRAAFGVARRHVVLIDLNYRMITGQGDRVVVFPRRAHALQVLTIPVRDIRLVVA